MSITLPLQARTPLPPSNNRLLGNLSQAELERFVPALQPVVLKRDLVLHEAGGRIDYVYFPTCGAVSMVIESGVGAVEVASVGDEGLVGIATLLQGDSMTTRAFVQAAGHAYRVKVPVFRALLDECADARLVFSRYALALFEQVARSVACNRLHALEARCARWLLEMHDRVEGDQIFLTQESLSYMLGVHRPAVTLAAGLLHKAGYIEYSRGRITVIDRAGLEGAACSCYQSVRDAYDSLLGSGAE